MESKIFLNFRETKLLPYIKFRRLVISPPFIFLRVSLIFLSLVFLFIFISRFFNINNLFSVKILNPFFVLAWLYLIFEIYLFNLSLKKPYFKVLTVQNNFSDCFTFSALELINSSLLDNDKVSSFSFLRKISSKILGKFVFEKAGLNLEQILKNVKEDSFYDLEQLLSFAFVNAKNEGSNYVSDSNLLYAAFEIDQNLQKAIFDAEIRLSDLQNIIFWYKAAFLEKKSFIENLFVGAGISEEWSSGYTLTTEKFGSDITQALSKKQINPFVVGREKEISQMEKILSKSERSNVILVGPAGVGKSSIVYGFARKSSQGATLPNLRYFRVLYLDVGALIAGTQNRGEIEERLKKILVEVQTAGNVILYLDEIQNLAGALIADRPIDLTGLMVDTLSSSHVHVIASTTPVNFRRYIEPRSSFLEFFEKMDILELSKDETIRALEKVSLQLEERFPISITYKAIISAVELSNLYIQGKVLPGKAIDLLEESSADVVNEGKKVLEKEEIEKLITCKTGVPVGKAKNQEGKTLLGLEELLHKSVIGQDEAIKAVSDALRRARVMVRKKERPIGSFLFLGPTGVGKTQTAKTIAAAYFGSENSMIRLDMSEFSQSNSSDLLIGSQYGSQSGQLTEAVKSKPYSLILLDELEKAHRDVLNLFLQVFDDGRLVDAQAAIINFSETIIIATSNAGSELIRESVKKNVALGKLKTELLEFLQKERIFTPEFLNRFDEIIVFKPLTTQELIEVAKIELGELENRLQVKDISFEISPKALAFVANLGYDPVYGARPLRRVIQDTLEAQIAKLILAEKLKRGERVIVDIPNGKTLEFNVKMI